MTYANDTHATFARILKNLGAHFSAEFSAQNERFDTQNFREQNERFNTQNFSEQDELNSDFCEFLKALFDINASKANADDLREIGENPAEFFAQSALFSAPHFDFENALLYYTNTDLSDIAPASTGHKNIGFTLMPCASHKRADLANATRAINKAIANYNIIFFVGEDSSLRGGKAIHTKNSVNLNQNPQNSLNFHANSAKNPQIQSENSRPHLSIAFATRRFSRQSTLKKDIVEKIIIIKDINLRTPSLAQLLNLEKLHREFASTLAHAKAQPIALDEFYARVIEIFSVSALNSEFYAEIVRIFNALWHECKFPPNTSEGDKRAFCLRLICRLLFCKFLEKKGLIDERLWDTNLAQDYYHELLEPLFFATLNTPQNERDYLSYGILDENSAPTCHSEPAKAGEESTPYKESVNLKMDSSHSANAQNDETNANSAQNSPNLQALLNAIPYLNGGLFAAQKNDFFNPQNPVQNRGILSVPNALIEQFFTLLNRYHFSIDEGSVNVQIVGLNPELLGLVFENLLAKLSSEQDEAALAKSLQSDIEDFEKSQKSEKNPKNSQRKATGSYYTPREIVSFMVRESLFAYLCRATKIQAEKLREFIFSDEAAHFENAETSAILAALKSLKILDPACGSGAFPMGILNEILALQERLGDTRTPHARKLEALQSCIYGIDIQPMATEIARLRCFLSLIIDENPHDIKPLPNLEFKFMQGNSLLESLSVGDSMLEIIPKDYLAPQKMGLFDESEIKSAKDLSLFDEKDYKHLQGLFVRYFSANKASAKAGLKNEILDLMRQVFDKRQADFENEIEKLEKDLKDKKVNSTNAKKYANQITDLMGAGAALQSLLHDYATRNFASDKLFLYRFFFAEVMQNGGFDIVIGNPPYGAKITPQERENYKKLYKISTTNTAQLFIIKADGLLKNGGVNAFIVPKSLAYVNTWKPLRALIQDDLRVFADCSKAFENVLLEAVVYVRVKGEKRGEYSLLLLKNKGFLDLGISVDKRLVDLFGIYFNDLNQSEINLGVKIRQIGETLEKYCQNSRGVGFQKHLKSVGKYAFYGGKEIARYCVKECKGFADDIKSAATNAFIKENSLLVQNIVTKNHIVATLPQSKEIYLLDTINQLTFVNLDARLMLGILNSNLMSWYVGKFIFANAQMTMHFDSPVSDKIPIPKINSNNQNLVDKIVNLVEKNLEFKSQNKDTSELEKDIDILVYKLYNLTPSEIQIIEGKQ